MIPPAYDIILENPIENISDTRATVDMLYEMPRHFTLNVYALRIIPNTLMAKDIEKMGLKVPPIDKNYTSGYHRTLGNLLVFFLTFWKIPRWLYKILRNKIFPVHQKQSTYPILFWITRMLYLIKRAYNHLRFMDFSILPGKPGYILWKIGVIRFWQRFMLKNYNSLKAKSQIALKENILRN